MLALAFLEENVVYQKERWHVVSVRRHPSSEAEEGQP